jgi:hypothetical protein
MAGMSLLCKILSFAEVLQFTGVNPLESDVDSDPVVKAVAIGCVAVLTIWNCFGTILLTRVAWSFSIWSYA